MVRRQSRAIGPETFDNSGAETERAVPGEKKAGISGPVRRRLPTVAERGNAWLGTQQVTGLPIWLSEGDSKYKGPRSLAGLDNWNDTALASTKGLEKNSVLQHALRAI